MCSYTARPVSNMQMSLYVKKMGVGGEVGDWRSSSKSKANEAEEAKLTVEFFKGVSHFLFLFKLQFSY